MPSNPAIASLLQSQRPASRVADPREIDRVFLDSQKDQVSAKRYTFHQFGSVSVIGQVDDYEPETIWLCVEASQLHVAACAEILQEYNPPV